MKENHLNRCTEWRGEHAAVVAHDVNYIDLLARYEDTGMTPEDIMAMFSTSCEEEKKESKPNTIIHYLYRDADNYKVWNSAVVAGRITEQEKADILSSLEAEEYFIPSLVGLEGERFSTFDPEVDHEFFELGPESFEYTDRKPDTNMTAAELTARFKAVSPDGWHL